MILELDVNTAISDRHVIFGLPSPEFLNSAFTGFAIAAGVACLPIDLTAARTAVLAADVIAGRDPRRIRYLKWYRQRPRDGK